MPSGVYIRTKKHAAWNKGIKLDRTKYPNMGHLTPHSKESRDKISVAKGSPKERERARSYMLGRKMSVEAIEKMRLSKIGKCGENAYAWKGGLPARKRQDVRNDSAYHGWRMGVWKRDGFKCKINNDDCCGKIEAHHILSWREYVELRYEVNNGITLCHAHHPRKRKDEQRLIPAFRQLVGSN